jgi:hypothetical protein
MEKESVHKKHSIEKYLRLIKHELCHLFFNIVSKDFSNPIWLNEGLATYLSGDVENRKRVDIFSHFLEFYNKGGSGVYSESGMAVKLLVENFGKKKILKLISRSKNADNKNKFVKLFKKIYGFDLNYKNFSNLLHKK